MLEEFRWVYYKHYYYGEYRDDGYYYKEFYEGEAFSIAIHSIIVSRRGGGKPPHQTSISDISAIKPNARYGVGVKRRIVDGERRVYQ